MSEYFRVKTVLPQDGSACKVEVLENLGQTEKDQWGNIKTAYNIKVDDKTLLRWEATDNQISKMKKCGENPFVMKRWDKDGKTGFNFFPVGDINVQPQNCEPALSGSQIEAKVQGNKDEFQDKVSRGAAWNNAFSLCLQGLKGDADPIKFCKQVSEVAEAIAPYQKSFVNGEKVDAVDLGETPNVADKSEPLPEEPPEVKHELPF